MTTAQTILALLAITFCLASAMLSRSTLQHLISGQYRAYMLLAGIAFASLAAVLYYKADSQRLLYTINGHDVFHYYLNSKYFEALGYEHLYVCALAADASAVKPLWTQTVDRYRQQSDYRIIDAGATRSALARERCTALFGAEDWADFSADVAAIGARMPIAEARNMFLDRGFNATPLWILVSEPIVRHVPARHLDWLTKIDFAFMLGAMLAVVWAYGALAAISIAALFFLMWFSNWPLLGTAYFRFDWIAALLIAMSLLKREHFVLAGVLAGWAVAARIFPAALVVAVGIRAASCLYHPGMKLSELRLPARYGHFLAGLLGFLLLLVLAALVRWGTDPFSEFSSKMALHTEVEHIAGTRPGVAMALVYRGELSVNDLLQSGGFPAKLAAVEQLQIPLLVVAMLLALLAFWALRFRRDDEVFAIGTVLFFFATVASSYYYWVLFLLPALWHLDHLCDRRHAVALAMLVGASTLVPVVEHLWQTRYVSMAWLSIAMLLYFIWVVVGIIGRDALRAPQAARELMGSGRGRETVAGSIRERDQ